MIFKETIHDAPLANGYEQRNCHKTCHVAIADSVGEFAETVAAAPDRLGNHLSSHFLGREIRSISQAAEFATQCWQEGVLLVTSMMEEIQGVISPKVNSRRRKRRWSPDSGDEVCVDRLRAGQEFFQDSYRATVKGRGCVAILNDMSAAGAISPQNVLWRGAASIVLTHALEQAGYRVELWTAKMDGYCFTNSDDMLVAAKIKAASQPLDIGSAVSAVSAWFYRSLGFYSANLFEPRPDSSCGYDREGGLRLFADRYFIRPGETGFIVENIWSRQAAMELVNSATDAINRGDISACKWAYSPWDKVLA